MVQGGVLIGADPDPSYVELQRKVKDLVRIYRDRTLDADLQPSTDSSRGLMPPSAHRTVGMPPG